MVTGQVDTPDLQVDTARPSRGLMPTLGYLLCCPPPCAGPGCVLTCPPSPLHPLIRSLRTVAALRPEATWDPVPTSMPHRGLCKHGQVLTGHMVFQEPSRLGHRPPACVSSCPPSLRPAPSLLLQMQEVGGPAASDSRPLSAHAASCGPRSLHPRRRDTSSSVTHREPTLGTPGPTPPYSCPQPSPHLAGRATHRHLPIF